MSIDDNKRRLAYLDALGIQVWQARQAFAPIAEEPEDVLPSVVTWNSLEADVAACTQCELSCQRTQSVFGVGDRQADWLVIGEAPGADEDKQGEPFVGRAGQLLNLMLQAIDLKRQDVYIANIVKCRPPANRDPKADEVAACAVYLRNQIALIQPKVILAVGRIAAHHLLDTTDKVGALRGTRHIYADTGIPLVVTYHPAYLLRAPREKAKSWQDLLLARQVVNESNG